MMQKIFGPPPPTPQEMAEAWKKQLQAEARNCDKQVRLIQREELKLKQSAKVAAKKGDIGSVKLLAKELVRAKVTVRRLETTKAQLNSVARQINMQLSQVKVTKALATSTGIMSHMNSLCRVPQIASMMRQMQAEMTKSGLVEEMVGDAMDMALDDDVDESELDAEVNAVVKQIMDKQLAGTDVSGTALPSTGARVAAAADDEGVPEEAEDVGEEDAELAAKFAALTGAAAAASSG
jgi:charged multivesicular body protein 3